jgi:hypothetical protein
MKKLLQIIALFIFTLSLSTLHAQQPSCAFNITVVQYQSISCFGDCNGSYVATAHSGTPPYRWNGGPYTNNATDTGRNLCVGSYTVTARDTLGCTATAVVTITQPAPLSLNIINVISPTCGGCPDGSATGSTTGGTSPYSYLWTPGGQTTATVTGLTAGTYTCCVTDSHGCMTCTPVTLTPTGINELSTESPDFTILPNPNNGTFQLRIANFQSSAEYSIEVYNVLGEKVYHAPLSAQSTIQSIDISGLGKGVYILSLKTGTQQALKKVVVY